MPEWLNGTVSKTVVRATVPRVRIPLSPPKSKCPAIAGIFVCSIRPSLLGADAENENGSERSERTFGL